MSQCIDTFNNDWQVSPLFSLSGCINQGMNRSNTLAPSKRGHIEIRHDLLYFECWIISTISVLNVGRHFVFNVGWHFGKIDILGKSDTSADISGKSDMSADISGKPQHVGWSWKLEQLRSFYNGLVSMKNVKISTHILNIFM